MPALTDVASGIDALGGVKSVELMNTPKVVKCVMPKAFEGVVNVTVQNVGEFSEVKALKVVIEKKRMEEEERKRKEEAALELELKKNPVICNLRDWEQIDKSVVEVIVVSFLINLFDDAIKVVDLSGCNRLRELKIDSMCFMSVTTVRLIGLKCLESVVIGQNSFVKRGYSTADGRDNNRRFYLKKCPRLKELRIGEYSFMDYSVCEIEDVDALEMIAIGDVDGVSGNFWFASLELRRMIHENE